MNVLIHPGAPLKGVVRVPPDKAIAHRAVLLAALARGDTEITPWPSGDDCQRTLALVEALGAGVTRMPEGIRIVGRGLRPPAGAIFCGESGTTMRLAAGLLAGQPFASMLSAGPSLSRRPMRRIADPLVQMGAKVEGPEADGAELHPPLRIQGRQPLRAIRYICPVASAQVKSAILLAALSAEGRTTIVEPAPTRDHTERLLRRCGVRVEATGSSVSIEPGPLAPPGPLALPGDPSSAAFFIVAALCVSGSRLKLERVSLNPTRCGFLEMLGRMGARIQVESDHDAWEPRGTITVESQPLRSLRLESQDVPAVIDELPILMVAAACASGRSRLAGLTELRVKETDRVRSMVDGLARLGASVRVSSPDTVEIDGGPLTGGTATAAGDHRTAMSLAIAALAARGPTTVQGAECVAKSFPEFFDQLAGLTGSPTVKSVDNP